MPFIVRKSITETFLARVRSTPEKVGFQYRQQSKWKQLTFREFYEDCRLIAFGLMRLGVGPGDKIALLSSTRFEWPLCDHAILGCRAVSVPIYPSSTASETAFILEQSEAKMAFVEDSVQLQKLLQNGSKTLQKIIVIDSSEVTYAALDRIQAANVITLHSLRELGRLEEARVPQRFDQNLLEVHPTDLFTITYTSGTTGIPKGVMLTHDNMMSVLEDCMTVLSRHTDPEAEETISFLPFAHILGRVESMAIWTFGWKQSFAESAEKLMDNMEEVRPTLIFAVPRVFEKAYNAIQATIEEGPTSRKKLFEAALETGRGYYNAIWAKRSPSLKDSAAYEVAKRTIFKPISARFGGRLRFAVCGGAPLPREIGEFCQIMGLKILEGYGLTETCAPVSLNPPEDPRFGTVGRPLPEVSIQIAEDGEILVHSRKNFVGYYKMPEETQATLRDGWLHTGDIGRVDADGYLHITDRKKDILITSAGKNIAPQKIENLAKSKKLVHQFVVVGDRRNYLTALITLHQDQAIQIATENHILFSAYKELIRNPKIISRIQLLVDEINENLASFETIKKFLILPEDLTIEAGELTPSLKIRRKFVVEKYRAEIDRLYAGS